VKRSCEPNKLSCLSVIGTLYFLFLGILGKNNKTTIVFKEEKFFFSDFNQSCLSFCLVVFFGSSSQYELKRFHFEFLCRIVLNSVFVSPVGIATYATHRLHFHLSKFIFPIIPKIHVILEFQNFSYYVLVYRHRFSFIYVGQR